MSLYACLGCGCAIEVVDIHYVDERQRGAPICTPCATGLLKDKHRLDWLNLHDLTIFMTESEYELVYAPTVRESLDDFRSRLAPTTPDTSERDEGTRATNNTQQEPLFYIQNTGWVGNCARWWKTEGNGYTGDLNEAGTFSKDEAARLCRSRPHEDIPYPVDEIDKIAQRHVTADPLIRLGQEIAKDRLLAEVYRKQQNLDTLR